METTKQTSASVLTNLLTVSVPTTVLDSFASCARAQPSKTALVQGHESLSYSDLHLKSANLARVILAAPGYKSKAFIPIVCSRSVSLIVGMLAVLKAGCAFVVIDASLPTKRILQIIEESQSQFLLLGRSDVPPESSGALASLSATIVHLDETRAADSPNSHDATLAEISPSDPAYVVFTSGSTGTPKGVVIKHGSLLDHVRTQIPSVYNVRNLRIATIVSINFDTFISDVFLALCNDSILHLRENDNLNVLKDVDSVHLTPSLLRKITPADHSNLKQIISGGEPLTREIIQTWLPHVLLYNSYGPSEITITSSVVKIDHLDAVISIGKPLPNTRQYIVNPTTLQVLEQGKTGELLIGGIGVSLGYLNRPQLTEERFIANHIDNDGTKLYRTGDMCRYLASGEIEFQGRADEMVKINGFRIELNEVRANLEYIQSAEVLNIDDKLIAFVTPDTVDVDLVLEAASERLPHYMIPSLIIPLVDKKKLAQIDLSNYTSSGIPFSGMRPEEQYLSELVAKLLKMDVTQINSNSNFFELGIDSISAIQIAKGCQKIGLDIKSSDVFSKPTARLLMKHAMKKKMNLIVKQLSNRGLTDFRACSPEQEEYYNCQKTIKHAYMAQYIWDCKDENHAKVLGDGWKFVIQKHEILHSQFVEEAPGVLKIPREDYSLNVRHVTGTLSEFLEQDLGTGFGMLDTNWIRLTQLKDANQTHFIVTMSHIVFDGWSFRLFLKDLQDFAMGKADPTPRPSLSHKFENIDKLKTFWTAYLKDIPTLLSPKVLQPFGESSKQIAVRSVAIKDLSTASANLLTTPRMVLKAAWALALQQVCQSNDIVFGEVVTGRETTIKGIEELTGCLISTIPCRVKRLERDSFFSLVKRMSANHVKTSESTTVSASLIESWIGKKPFSSIFIFQNLNGAFDLSPEWKPSRLNESAVWHEGRDTIELQIFPKDDSIGFTIDYFSAQIDDGTVEALSHALRDNVEKLTTHAINKLDFELN
ncbi:hypothetical protein HDU91_004960 [Kappamyces sp. JEL0680]|nr:hypothetical protein HDU91_004960 [Kappamyces sp. JEL0680]